MNISHWKPLLGGAFAFLLVLHGTVVKADDNKSKDSSKAKKETKYDRLFKDKKTETARSKFITVYKQDNKIYFELPRTLLKKQMILGGTITSTTDPTTVTVGSTSANPVLFYFDIQDSSVLTSWHITMTVQQ